MPQSNLQNYIDAWLASRLASSATAEDAALFEKLASVQTQYVKSLSGGPDAADAVSLFLASTVNDPEWRFGAYAMPAYRALSDWVRDQVNKASEDTRLNVFRYEIAMLKNLPDASISAALRDYGLSMIRYADVLSELQSRFLIERNWDEGSWIGQFTQALRNNKELLGRDPIVLNNNSYQPTVSAWLQKFDTSHANSLAGAPDAYDQVKFFNRDSQVAALTSEEKQLLASVLHLYSWLQNPDVDEIELEAKQRADVDEEDAGIDEQALAKAVAALKPVRVVQDLPPANKIDSIAVPKSANVDFNVQRMLNRGTIDNATAGVTFDQQSNVQVEEMAQRLEADRQRQRAAIDQKIAALKKRSSS